jgi:hypothetical protein
MAKDHIARRNKHFVLLREFNPVHGDPVAFSFLKMLGSSVLERQLAQA